MAAFLAVGYGPMKVTRAIAHFIVTLAFVVAGVAALQGVAIVAFGACGTLTPGEPMFGGGSTPTLGNAAMFSVVGLAICVLLGTARHKLSTAGVSSAANGSSVGA